MGLFSDHVERMNPEPTGSCDHGREQQDQKPVAPRRFGSAAGPCCIRVPNHTRFQPGDHVLAKKPSKFNAADSRETKDDNLARRR